jgi:hypothetical protein
VVDVDQDSCVIRVTSDRRRALSWTRAVAIIANSLHVLVGVKPRRFLGASAPTPLGAHGLDTDCARACRQLWRPPLNAAMRRRFHTPTFSAAVDLFELA